MPDYVTLTINGARVRAPAGTPGRLARRVWPPEKRQLRKQLHSASPHGSLNYLGEWCKYS